MNADVVVERFSNKIDIRVSHGSLHNFKFNLQ
jgi:hypothetical protein